MATISSEVIDLTELTDSSDSSSEDGREVGMNGEEDGSEDGSDVSEIEITLDEETRSQLQSAISTVSETRLRQLLKFLVETDKTIEMALTRELITLKRETQKIVPRWETCRNCDKEFDTNTIREDTECNFHPG
jgi:predicted Zn-ribbon and HTH transcriptional regulator